MKTDEHFNSIKVAIGSNYHPKSFERRGTNGSYQALRPITNFPPPAPKSIWRYVLLFIGVTL